MVDLLPLFKLPCYTFGLPMGFSLRKWHGNDDIIASQKKSFLSPTNKIPHSLKKVLSLTKGYNLTFWNEGILLVGEKRRNADMVMTWLHVIAASASLTDPSSSIPIAFCFFGWENDSWLTKYIQFAYSLFFEPDTCLAKCWYCQSSGSDQPFSWFIDVGDITSSSEEEFLWALLLHSSTLCSLYCLLSLACRRLHFHHCCRRNIPLHAWSFSSILPITKNCWHHLSHLPSLWNNWIDPLKTRK